MNPRTLRARLGLSQAGLARLLGVSRIAVQSWERGIRGLSGPTLIRLTLLDRYPTGMRPALENLAEERETRAGGTPDAA